MEEVRRMAEVETQEQVTARIVAQTAAATAIAVSQAAQAAALVIAKEGNVAITEIAVLKSSLSVLKEAQSSFEGEMNRKFDSLDTKVDVKFDKVFLKLEEIAQGRPTWAVAIIMGGLCSLCVGLGVFVLSH